MEPPTSPKGRGRPKTRDRERLVDDAMHAFWSHASAAVSINALCEQVGVSKPSLYREFKNEDELTEAVLAHYAGHMLQPFIEIASSKRPLREKLNALIALVSEAPPFTTGCLFVKMHARRSAYGPLTQRRIDELASSALSLYGRMFTEAKRNGEWEGSPPAELAAAYVLAQIGLGVTERAQARTSAEVRAMMELAFSGFTSPSEGQKTARGN